MIGWTTGVVASSDAWGEWLAASELLATATQVLQLNLPDASVREDRRRWPVQLLHPQRGGRMLEFDELVTGIEPAIRRHQMRAPIVVLHPPKAELQAAASSCVERADMLCSALSSPITVAVELTGDVASDGEFILMLQSLTHGFQQPRLGLVLDTEHQAHKGSDILGLLRLYGRFVAAVHIKDYDGAPWGADGSRRYIRYGRGIIDLPRVLTAIRRLGVPAILEGRYETVRDFEVDFRQFTVDWGSCA